MREPPAALGSTFSFNAFVVSTERDGLCRELSAAIRERLQNHPSPAQAFEDAISELKAAGHDLWRWDLELWGPDYMTRRPGRGLLVKLEPEDDDWASVAVHIEFDPER